MKITNWPMVDTNGPTDIAVLRPTEVLFEEWLALRKKGIKTPQITLWPCSPKGSNTWKYLVDKLYNNPIYDQLIFRLNGKKSIFIPYNPSCYDYDTTKLIGRNDILTVPVWALFGFPIYKTGVWGFFSPCVDNGAYTTSMIGVGPCIVLLFFFIFYFLCFFPYAFPFYKPPFPHFFLFLSF